MCNFKPIKVWFNSLRCGYILWVGGSFQPQLHNVFYTVHRFPNNSVGLDYHIKRGAHHRKPQLFRCLDHWAVIQRSLVQSQLCSSGELNKKLPRELTLMCNSKLGNMVFYSL